MKHISLLMVMCLTGLLAGGLEQEVDRLKGEIATKENKTEAVETLVRLNGVYKQMKMQRDALAYLEGIKDANPGNVIEAAARCLSVPMLIKQGQYDTAREYCLYVKENFVGTNWAAEALQNLSELYENVYEDMDIAEEYQAELAREYADWGNAIQLN